MGMSSGTSAEPLRCDALIGVVGGRRRTPETWLLAELLRSGIAPKLTNAPYAPYADEAERR